LTNSNAVSTTLHLTSGELAEVRRILADSLPDTEVWAFGSRVHGRHLKRYSDLDLAVAAPRLLASGRMAAAQAAFAESDLPFRIDLVEIAAVDKAFRQVIESDHVVLQD